MLVEYLLGIKYYMVCNAQKGVRHMSKSLVDLDEQGRYGADQSTKAFPGQSGFARGFSTAGPLENRNGIVNGGQASFLHKLSKNEA